MRVVLLSSESFVVLSYPAMMLLAVGAALGALAYRMRGRPIERAWLGSAVLAALVVGWIASRLTVALSRYGPGGLSIRSFMPTEHVGMSFTGFMAAAVPVFLVYLWYKKLPLLANLDAVAPSAVLGLSVAKIGCLLAGCCAGAVCSEGWGVRYPYGSRPYEVHVSSGGISPPAALVRKSDDGIVHSFGHIDILRAVRDAPPEELADHSKHFGLTYESFVHEAGTKRSLPVWPVPIWYGVTAGLLWFATEALFRRNTRTGWTVAAVLMGYGAMRLAFDPFLAKTGDVSAGSTLAQVVALIPLICGAVIGALCLLKKTPRICTVFPES